MKDLMEQGHTRILNGREIILAEDKYGRIGWVFKDTGLVPTEDDMEPRWKDHTKECPNCAKMEEDMAILMARLERALQEKTK